MPLLGRAKETRQLPPTVATDEVLPVHMFDGSSAARGIILVWTYKFDDILDPHKIHDALTTLFQMPGWRKFSGRFRPRASNSFILQAWFSMLTILAAGRQVGDSRTREVYQVTTSCLSEHRGT